jgi:hypothetical protein
MSILYDPVNQQPFVNVPRYYLGTTAAEYVSKQIDPARTEQVPFAQIVQGKPVNVSANGLSMSDDALSITLQKRGKFLLSYNARLGFEPQDGGQLQVDVSKRNSVGETTVIAATVMYGSTGNTTDETIALTSIFDGSVGDVITVAARNTNDNANSATVYYPLILITTL